jgi:hypothetical protein
MNYLSMNYFLRPFFALVMAALFAASSILPTDAAPRVAPQSRVTSQYYDGVWSVSIVTMYGDCSRGYRYPVRIINGRVLKADNDPNYQVYGAVSRNGAIAVTVSGGGQTASGAGRLSRSYGSGRWRTTSGECSGQWTAERRG